MHLTWVANCKGDSVVANVIIVGTQWGDEGKGKIVDLLAENADMVGFRVETTPDIPWWWVVNNLSVT